jgi:hypothetical protein
MDMMCKELHRAIYRGFLLRRASLGRGGGGASALGDRLESRHVYFLASENGLEFLQGTLCRGNGEFHAYSRLPMLSL